jgi:hypothetical protein
LDALEDSTVTIVLKPLLTDAQGAVTKRLPSAPSEEIPNGKIIRRFLLSIASVLCARLKNKPHIIMYIIKINVHNKNTTVLKRARNCFIRHTTQMVST